MGSNKKEQKDVSDLGVTLPAAAAAHTEEDLACLVIALKNKLRNLSERHLDVPENLTPTVGKRIELLRDIQIEHYEMDAKFFEEIAALELKYQKQYETLYSKGMDINRRYDLVNGVVEVDGVNNNAANDLVAANDQADDKEEKGVDEFWLTAMKNNKLLSLMIHEQDEDALKYLKDIKWCRINDPVSFKLEFFFDANPYFKNSVLTLVYATFYDDYDFLPNNAIG
ncbi:nucleosome assembly protein 1;4-like [Rutidosis leptorrhynchoides]|uniref:nucleosome assembly protein 1;4-like n=1 Tax=Rutidosis leptorrhynchoides TaxID=125765 RepID=UPI003A998DF5